VLVVVVGVDCVVGDGVDEPCFKVVDDE